MLYQLRLSNQRLKYWGACLAVLLMLLGTLVGAVVSAQSTQKQSITLTVQTPEYTLDEQGLQVKGYGVNDSPGAPALPIWSQVVELPPTGEWQVSYQSAGVEEVALAEGLVLPSVPVPHLKQDAIIKGLQAETFAHELTTSQAPKPDIYQRNAFYPTSLLLPAQEQWQRGRRLLLLQLFPFQYNPVTGIVRHHSEIEITIEINGIEQQETVRGKQDASQFTPLNRLATGEGVEGAVRLYTAERGLYRVTYDELLEAGVPVETLDPTTFAVSHLGELVAIQVLGEEDGSFDADDLLIFYAEPYQKRYMNENLYWLSYGGTASPRIETRSVTPTGDEPVVTVISQTHRVEFNEIYISTFERPMDADHLFDDALFANNVVPTNSVTYQFELDDPLTNTGELELRTRLHGAYEALDNSIEIVLNNQSVNLYQWNGRQEYITTDTVPANWLNGISNQLTLIAALSQLPEPSEFFAVYPDWVEMTYPAQADADGSDRLYIERLTEGANEVQVAGFTEEEVLVVDIRNPLAPVQLLSVTSQETGDSYTLSFWDQALAEPTYYLSTKNALLTPSAIELDTPSNWQSNQHVADYIAIVPAALWEAPPELQGIDDLLAHREAEGLRVAKVALQDIYDEFSWGQVDPQAIRDFLGYAYHNWNEGEEPPQYVLLVGDGHYDFKGELDTPLLNLIPPYLAHVDPWLGEVPADNRYVSVDGADDYLPDMSIGRLPAQIKWDEDTQSYLEPTIDIDAMVNKIISYETTTPDGEWQERVVFVADNLEDPGGNFHEISEHIRLEWLPASYDSSTIYYNSSPALDDPEEMRAAIKEAFNNDTLMIQWIGHGSFRRWGSANMFNHYDPEGYQGHIPLDANTEWPLTVSYGPLTSHFTTLNNYQNSNVWQSLGEALVRAPQRGSIADIGPSGLHITNASVVMNQGIVQAIFQNRIARLGEAQDAAKLYYYSNSSEWHDLIDTYLLLGDPATRLRLPLEEEPNTPTPSPTLTTTPTSTPSPTLTTTPTSTPSPTLTTTSTSTPSPTLTTTPTNTPTPQLSSISPDSAVGNAGNVPLIIEGQHFEEPLTAHLGNVALLTVTLKTTSTLHAVVPVGSLSQGTHDFTLQSNGSSLTLPDAFTVTEAVSPTQLLAMIYLGCDNNLTEACERLFNNLELAMHANPDLHLVALWDGEAENDSAYYLVQPDDDPETWAQYSDGINRIPLGEVDSAHPDTLVSFVAWAQSQYPAQYTFLSLVGHGQGWAPDLYPGQVMGIGYEWGVGGMLWDEGNTSVMSTAVLAEALAALSTANSLDLLYLDACLMSTVEVAAELAPYAQYIVAHENIAWATYAYDEYLSSVDSSTTPSQLAEHIAQSNVNSWPAEQHPGQVNLLLSAQISALLPALDTLALELLAILPDARPTIQEIVEHTAHIDENVDWQINTLDSALDLYHFAEELNNHPEMPTLRQNSRPRGDRSAQQHHYRQSHPKRHPLAR